MVRVIGSGLGRTGTTSLKEALEILGFNPCYHMQEVIKRPAYTAQWYAISQGAAPDWDAVFDGWQATVDHPACFSYKELMEHYPDAKFVHAVRDAERWWESTYETIHQTRTMFPMYFRWLFKTPREYIAMNEAMIWGEEGYYEGRFADRAFTIEKFHAHTNAVTAAIPADRLLVFSVKDGWEPLCEFLGVPVPDVPFPHVRERRQLIIAFTVVRVVTRAIPVLLALLILWGGWWLLFQ